MRRTRVAVAAVAGAVVALAAAVAVAAFGVGGTDGSPSARFGSMGLVAAGSATGTSEPPGVNPPRLTAAGALTPARLLGGVGPLPPGWVSSVHTLAVGGLNRVYLTVEPAHPTGPMPVVVLLHGRDMTPDAILHMTGLVRLLGSALLVVPAGWNEFWNAGDCCGAAYLKHVDDIGFIQAAVKSVLASTPEASTRDVYAVGFSNGGRMAYQLACDLPGVFRGVMAVEAVPVQACPAMRPLDVTIVAQAADPLVTVSPVGRPKTVGGFIEPTVSATVEHVAALDGCRTAPSITPHGQALEKTWRCADGTLLRYVWYPGGAHTWRPLAPGRPGTPGASDFVGQLIGLGA